MKENTCKNCEHMYRSVDDIESSSAIVKWGTCGFKFPPFVQILAKKVYQSVDIDIDSCSLFKEMK